MFSLRSVPARGTRNILSGQYSRLSSRQFSLLTRTAQSTSCFSQPLTPVQRSRRKSQFRHTVVQRPYSAKSAADSLIEDIQDQYAVARDEFEIATEETEKQTVYAQADRDAAREELDKLKRMYEEALGGREGEEIQKRVGNRIRELDHAVQALEQLAQEGDH
ncbi:uncharacterized protein L3040_004939 [Drepanopeziza brunnea f. sp. 'multigermtubi']|uniref:Uncharacterized protein n=1 Tax=Marssonina brunnea f. sp. multigermtubi (strain MB_m1) TaxID=1072389 RepID=K1X9P8_MARBU|nr:uncharacterized protein MBM_00830 [Drepanopeziza brunnea f. sp. 'multigermtubi' MB_m1]EKD21717.1 hypothetical protein MBM_00830 [Drepanopeziza brunnea f. sp. 'multigermtubi' MB_m1]KAJ5042390.1 hypothetical protein L3040_004939 [Drepanopeziza brunnea f. sp. 'multigermtubi']